MTYTRPQPASRLPPAARGRLLHEYYDEYAQLVTSAPDRLNRKIPRQHFRELLDGVGALLVGEAERMSREPGPVRDFLNANPLPPSLEGTLPDDFRVFCLALNALKQWVSAEQAATDRYLLGGTARADCRAAAERCVVSGVPLAGDRLELHHPLRDGRPPIPLDREAHARIEGQKKEAAGSRPAADHGTAGIRPEYADGERAYHASGLAFRARVIEALTDDEPFRIITPAGTFRMTRRDFGHVFASVAASATYRNTGSYAYSLTPRKALPFLLDTGPESF